MAKTKRGQGWVVRDFTDEFERSARNELEKAIARGGIRIQAEAKRLLNLHSSLGARKDPSIARSSPGEPPYKEFGTLGRSVDTETFERRKQFIARVGTNVKYGFWLEGGTQKMAPRPYLRPALDAMTPRIVRDIRLAGRRMRGRGASR